MTGFDTFVRVSAPECAAVPRSLRVTSGRGTPRAVGQLRSIAARSAGHRASSGSASTSARASSRARSMTAPSLTTRRNRRAPPRPRLRRAEHVALAPQQEVDARELEPVGGLRERLEPPRRAVCLGRVRDEQAQPGLAAAADAAAQLVQLREAEHVRVEDHHDGRGGHVDADLDDGRRDEHGGLAGAKSAIARSFSSPDIRPCRSPTARRPARVGRRVSATSSTARSGRLAGARAAAWPRRRSPARRSRSRSSPSSSCPSPSASWVDPRAHDERPPALRDLLATRPSVRSIQAGLSAGRRAW